MERHMNLAVMSELTKKKIRDAIGVKGVKGKSATDQLIKLAKLNDVNIGVQQETQIKRAYTFFGNIENELIVQRNKVKAEAKKNRVVVYTFDKINGDFSKNKLFKNYDDKPFKIVLKSALVEGVKKDFKFQNSHHLRNWAEAVSAGETMCDSENTWNQSDIAGGKNVFGVFSMNVSVIQGGRDNKTTADRTLKRTTSHIKCLTQRVIITTVASKF